MENIYPRPTIKPSKIAFVGVVSVMLTLNWCFGTELFNYRGIFRIHRISTMELFCENSKQLLVVGYIHKATPSKMLEWVLNMLQASN